MLRVGIKLPLASFLLFKGFLCIMEIEIGDLVIMPTDKFENEIAGIVVEIDKNEYKILWFDNLVTWELSNDIKTRVIKTK